MTSNLDDLLSAIIAANDAGLTIAAIQAKFVGKSMAKCSEAELKEKLASLGQENKIRGPFKFGRSQYYFAAGYGPSIETASKAVEHLILKSGRKLLSKPNLEKKVTGKDKPFFPMG